MIRIMLAAGAAALAIAAPAVAKPDKGEGGKGKAHTAQKMHDRAHKQSMRGSDSKRAHAPHDFSKQQNKAFKEQRRAERKFAKRQHEAQERAFRGHRKAHEQALKRDRKMHDQAFKAERRFAKQQEKAFRKAAERRDKLAEKAFKQQDRQFREFAKRERGFRDYGWDDIRGRQVGFVEGCPPGLARKPVPCIPPGHAKSFVGERLSQVQRFGNLMPLPEPLRYVYSDTPDYYYRYGNGYAYRVNRETQLINALLPLFGIGATVGQPFPSAYNTNSYYLPSGLQPFYQNSPYDYRYANGYVYGIDPRTGLVADVDPMLGYGYGYGQMLPVTYSAYNVPYQYRPLYQDSPNAYYRYAPGAIYQVDPQTSLITAIASLLAPGLAVGQPLPTGYGAYNVPYGYRDRYYDTNDNWYRYANGNIYQVDPTTQLVTALVASILT